MKKILSILFLLAAASIESQALRPTPEQSPYTDVQSIEIQIPWARVTQGKNGASYVTITSHTGDTLMNAKPGNDDLCHHVELHTHLEEDGVMKMRPVGSIEIAPEKPLIMAPGGLHIMLMGLKHPLKEGESFPLKLKFKQAGWIEVDIPVTRRIPISSKLAPAISEASTSCCDCCHADTTETDGSSPPSPDIKDGHGA